MRLISIFSPRSRRDFRTDEGLVLSATGERTETARTSARQGFFASFTFARAWASAARLLLLAAFSLPVLSAAGAGAYYAANVGNDRVLLMNNWKKGSNVISFQSYYDTSPTGTTYWAHSDGAASGAATYRVGTNHVLYASSGDVPLWRLYNCRAGWPQTSNNSLPVSPNAVVSSASGSTAASVRACVIMRNGLDSQIVSPYYEDGIGTVYFDAVNGFNNPNADVPTVILQIATNVTASAAEEEKSFDDVEILPDDLDWQTVPMTVIPVSGTKNLGTAIEGVTALELDAPGGGGSNVFYRVRATLNLNRPARFRIARTTVDDTNASLTADQAGVIMIDDIVASFPTMSYVLHTVGEEYDSALSGAGVIGRVGDFNVPFLSVGEESVLPVAECEMLMNNAPIPAGRQPSLQTPLFNYRWRYLNQVVGDWKTISMNVVDATQLVASASVPLTDGAGDLEYYFTAGVNSIYYNNPDFAYGTKVGWGSGWSEDITAITNRATYTGTLPSCGTDYFARIREGASGLNLQSVALTGSVTTNGVYGEPVSLAMEIVTNNIWRAHYYVPTNAVGETLRGRFTGVQRYTNGEDRVWLSRDVSWGVDALATSVPYIPCTVALNGGEDFEIRLDGASTHLLFEFNEKSSSFSVSHATYQNFNVWTDAVDGYRGLTSATTGVSDVKTQFRADMTGWELTRYDDDLWTEMFEPTTWTAADQAKFPFDTPFVSAETPSGWLAEHGKFVVGSRTPQTGKLLPQGMALQLEGRGQGSLSFANYSRPPRGVGAVSFTARVAQSENFDDFVFYDDAPFATNYALSAQVTMSRQWASDNNPLDISPAHPSVSFVGYYRDKKGCYEFRVARTSNTNLTAYLFKWQPGAGGMAPTLLTSNVLCSANLDSAVALGPNQSALGITTASLKNFNNMLVPTAANQTNNWTTAYFSLWTAPAGEVRLEGYLSSARNTSRIDQDGANLRKIIAWTDTAPGALTRGKYGVGSLDCQAAFGGLQLHPCTSTGIETGSNARFSVESTLDDWAWADGRWRRLTYGESYWHTTGFAAVLPTNQTVELMFAQPGATDNIWFTNNCTAVISSFSTNTFSFTPCMAPNYLVRLQAGGKSTDEVRTDVTIDDVVVTAWRAEDDPDMTAATYGKYEDWSYTMGTIEAAAEISDPNYSILPAGTNGYCFVFTNAAAGIITFTPTMDLVLDRALVVGGGGAGGWTIGGGGGGGGVQDADWSDAPVTVPAGTTLRIQVGAGGNNYYNSSNASANWRAGGSGGTSSLTGVPGKTTVTASGGGGGGSWNGTLAGATGASGGGSAHGNATQARGTQGFAGGRSNGEAPGGGGGAGEAGGNGVARTGSNYDGQAGKGGDGKTSDITGETLYYGGGGGGGGGNSVGGTATTVSLDATAGGGAGGAGGGGRGANRSPSANFADAAADGTDGLGGGGGGGGHSNGNAGGRGGSGCVILRVRTASVVCTLQPARGGGSTGTNPAYPISLRSPYLDNGLSMFSFSYAQADTNALLHLQICTNLADYGTVYNKTILPSSDTNDWNTVATWDFSTMTDLERTGGTLTHYVSLRAPAKGLMRLVVDAQVASNAMTRAIENWYPDYGKITVSTIYCYNEPALDTRSWWGWNLHTEGWNTDGKDWAYLTDSPNGLSCSLNFSALLADNTDASATHGIGLGTPDKAAEYAANNPFVQSPALTNGIGAVSFRARTFETNAANPSVLILYGSDEPDNDQVQVPEMWTRIAEFEITNKTYTTYSWKTDTATSPYLAVRLEVGGARHGRAYENLNGAIDGWETPSNIALNAYAPIQRVFIDEMSVSEPVVPRIAFRDVFPFRKGLTDPEVVAITNITSMDQQPLAGESWGVQARIEPQQMGDELDLDNISVHVAAYAGVTPWGYLQWSNETSVIESALERVGTNLVFRSSINYAASIMPPQNTPNTVVQFHIWAIYRDKSGKEVRYDLSASDWTTPAWYAPLDYNRTLGMGVPSHFSAYTILDSISPRRAWINEVNYFDADLSEDGQFVEFAVPMGADLDGWRLRVLNAVSGSSPSALSEGDLAVFGQDALVDLTTKSGPGVNHYAFVALRSPLTRSAGKIPEADGEWNAVNSTELRVEQGALKHYYSYGLELVRPSGIVEHQIVVQGTNYWEGLPLEYMGSGTNLLAQIADAGTSTTNWFFTGPDLGGSTLGVYRSHGEDATCWTNDCVATPGALNRRANGTAQVIDEDWYIEPLGDNVWIYASVLGDHIWQLERGNIAATNRSQIIVMQKGGDTNITYVLDPWYEPTNGVVSTASAGAVTDNNFRAGGSHRWTLALTNVTERTDVTAMAAPSQKLRSWGLTDDNPYTPAVMHWLLNDYPDSDDKDFQPAKFVPLSGDMTKAQDLTLTEMYWLDIDPVQGGWWFVAGMGNWGAGVGGSPAAEPVPMTVTDYYGNELTYTNVRVKVFMMITNTVAGLSSAAHGKAYPPYTLRGLAPGSSSADDFSVMSGAWTSATFKVTGALQHPDRAGVSANFLPLRWFVFGPDSFGDPNDPEETEPFTATIEIQDPTREGSPGNSYGWGPYHNIYPVFYRWSLDAGTSGFDTTEMLHKDSTY